MSVSTLSKVILLFRKHVLQIFQFNSIYTQWVDVDRRGCWASSMLFKPVFWGAFMVIKKDNNDSNIIMEMTPYSSVNFLYVIISHLPLLSSLLKSSSHQSLCNSLQVVKRVNVDQLFEWNQAQCWNKLVGKFDKNSGYTNNIKNLQWKLTALGFLKTISTTVWSLNCSHRPSDANIRNKSCGLSSLTRIEGSAVITGRFRGIGFPNCWNIGSL